MTESNDPNKDFRASKARLQRSNRKKLLRSIIEIVLIVVAVGVGVYSIVHSIQTSASGGPTSKSNTSFNSDGPSVQSDAGADRRFIAISYPGLTTSTSLESKIVNLETFKEQIEALHASGYVTITQQDIADFYLRYSTLPEKSLFLFFEDGIKKTTDYAIDTLKKHGYSATECTYADNLDDEESDYITADDIKTQINNAYWELGSNGYRLSYINVFDRYNNFFDQLNAKEFLDVRQYLWRDYNHYLMDFIRDEDRLRVESVEELEKRIQADYEGMSTEYTNAIGYVPEMYVLMHANTGAFGTDAIASEANRKWITNLYTMNYNREGSCLNTLDSSIYDLTRLQVQSYFSTNHMLMRIWDDTGDTLQFVTGDEDEASHWYSDEGVAEYKGNQIIVTSEPAGRGQITMNTQLFSDLDMTVYVRGNLVGRQSICLRTDREWDHGIEIRLEDNNFEIWDVGDDEEQLFFQNLFEFDGGPYISTQEDEHNGLIALQQAIIQYDTDPQRIAEATRKLQELYLTPVLTLEDGGTPYYPVNDTSTREERKLRIRLVGSRLSVWVDDKPIVSQLKVSGTQLGAISLAAKVYENTEEQYTQRYIFDDVYDAVFKDIVIYDAQDANKVLYSYNLAERRTINSIVTGWFKSITQFFVDHF